MTDHLRRYLEAWLLRAEQAANGGGPLDPDTEAAAARQALAEITPDIPTEPEPRCPACED